MSLIGPVPRYARNSEARAYEGAGDWPAPSCVVDGLAVYATGAGAPLLLFPYPHAATACPMAGSALARLLEGHRRVITFDPPGAYRSTRTPRVDLEEMLGCAGEALRAVGHEGPIDVVGHSMGALCALALAVEEPGRVRRLVLEGALSGFPAAVRHGLPGRWLRPGQRGYGLFTLGGLAVASGLGRMELMRRFLDLYEELLVMDPSCRVPHPLRPEARGWPVPVRARWTLQLFRGVDLSRRLEDVRAPTLVIVGEADHQTPVACAEELARGIPGSILVTVPGVGHAPHLEQPGRYLSAVGEFLGPKESGPVGPGGP